MEAMARFDADKIQRRGGSRRAGGVRPAHHARPSADERAPSGDSRGEALASCACDICRRDGIQVVIFRGNNRNRRRGFHNTYVFYRLLQQALAGQPVGFLRSGATTKGQLTFFGSDEAGEEAADAV